MVGTVAVSKAAVLAELEGHHPVPREMVAQALNVPLVPCSKLPDSAVRRALGSLYPARPRVCAVAEGRVFILRDEGGLLTPKSCRLAARLTNVKTMPDGGKEGGTRLELSFRDSATSRGTVTEVLQLELHPSSDALVAQLREAMREGERGGRAVRSEKTTAHAAAQPPPAAAPAAAAPPPDPEPVLVPESLAQAAAALERKLSSLSPTSPASGSDQVRRQPPPPQTAVDPLDSLLDGLEPEPAPPANDNPFAAPPAPVGGAFGALPAPAQQPAPVGGAFDALLPAPAQQPAPVLDPFDALPAPAPTAMSPAAPTPPPTSFAASPATSDPFAALQAAQDEVAGGPSAVSSPASNPFAAPAGNPFQAPAQPAAAADPFASLASRPAPQDPFASLS